MIEFFPLYKQSAAVYLLPDKVGWLIKLLIDSCIEREWNGQVEIYAKGKIPTFIFEIGEVSDQYRKN
jgi:hypothetical protein